MGNILTGDQYISIDGKLTEIKRQMRQKGGYPHDPKALDEALQRIIDGNFIGGKNENPVLREVFPGRLASWTVFYRDLFGIEKDFANLVIPAKPEGFDRLLVVAQGMTPNKLYAKCAQLFTSWRYTEDLDTVKSDRAATEDYVVWVRDRVEADKEMKNFSANDLRAQNITGITLEERLLLELVYFRETGKHLDVANVTLCSGSRAAGGDVPGVVWGGSFGGMQVYWYYPVGRYDDLRARVAVA